MSYYDDKSNYIRVRAIVSGRVQHVGFRYWACEQAERLGLTGTVQNLVMQGLPDMVGEMKEKLRHGPSMAIVSRVIFYRERVNQSETNFGEIY